MSKRISRLFTILVLVAGIVLTALTPMGFVLAQPLPDPVIADPHMGGCDPTLCDFGMLDLGPLFMQDFCLIITCVSGTLDDCAYVLDLSGCNPTLATANDGTGDAGTPDGGTPVPDSGSPDAGGSPSNPDGGYPSDAPTVSPDIHNPNVGTSRPGWLPVQCPMGHVCD